MIAGNFRRIVTRHYFDLRGRAGRAEFWNFVLACILLWGLATLATIVLSAIAHRLGPILAWLVPLLELALLPPATGIGARRLRDVGQSGALVWVFILPFANALLSDMRLLASGPGDYQVLGAWCGFAALVALVGLASFWMQPRAPAVSPA